MTGMVRRFCLLSCLLLSLSAEESVDDLALALVNISQGVSRPAGGLGVGPQDLPVEFDVVDRHTTSDVWWRTTTSDTSPQVRTLSAEKIIRHGTAEDRLAVIEGCLFDGRSFYSRSGCIVGSASVGDRVLTSGWGDLTDRQHWQLIATWLAQIDQDGNRDSGCSWRELGAPVRSAGFLHALQPWCSGTSEQRLKAAHLLWLMTQDWSSGSLYWAGAFRPALDSILRLSDDPEVTVRRAAIRALSEISVMWGDDHQPWRMQEQRLLRACDDPDLTVCLTAALWFVMPRDRFPEQIATQRVHALRTLLTRCTPELLPASKPWLRRLTQPKKFNAEQRPLFGDLAKRLVASDDHNLFGVGCALAARLDEIELDRLCAQRVTALGITDPDVLGRLLNLPLGQDLHQRLVRHVEEGDASPTHQRMELLSRFAHRRLGWEFRALDDEDPAVAFATFSALCSVMEPWIPDALVARLDDHPEQRRYRQQALDSLGLGTIEPALRRRMRIGDPMRTSAILALAHAARDIDRPEDLADLLRSILLDPRDPQRAAALHLLRKLWSHRHGDTIDPFDPDLIPTRHDLRVLLARFAEDPDPRVRREVLGEVVHFPARGHARLVFAGLEDTDANVRQMAARALVSLERTGAIVAEAPADEASRFDVITVEELRAGLTAADDFVRVAYATVLSRQPGAAGVEGMRYLIHHCQDDWTFDTLRHHEPLHDAASRADLLRAIPVNDPTANWRWRRLLCQTSLESESERYFAGLGDGRRAVRDAAWIHVNALTIHKPAPAADPQWKNYRAAADAIKADVERRDLALGLSVLGLTAP